MDRTHEWNELAAQLAVDSIRCSTAAGSGHPTSSLSAAHLLAVLYADHLRYDVADPKNLGERPVRAVEGPRVAADVVGPEGDRRDRRRAAADVPEVRLADRGPPGPACRTCRSSTSRPARSGRGCRSGSGWRSRCGWTASDARVWVLMGDSRESPRVRSGRRWRTPRTTACATSSAILDMNRLGQRGPTMLAVGGRGLRGARGVVRLARAAGRRPRRGGDRRRRTATAEDGARADADRGADREGPRRLVPGERGGLARQGAVAGRGRSRRSRSWAASARSSRSRRRSPSPRRDEPPAHAPDVGRCPSTRRRRDAEGVRRGARGAGRAPRRRRARRRGGELDPHRGLPEGRARPVLRDATSPSRRWSARRSGCRRSGKTPFAATFGAFLTRAYDFVRMAAISRANLRLCGSHAGVSIGEDGPSQMALEDLAMMRAVHGSTVLYPADGNATAALTRPMADLPGIVVHAHDPGEDAGSSTTPARRSRSAAAKILRSSGRGPRRRSSAPASRCIESLKAADALGRRGHRVPRDRLLLDQADRRRDAARRRWRETGLLVDRRGPLARGRHRRRRAGGARGGRRGPVRPRRQDRRHRDAGLGNARGAARLGRASPPRRSRTGSAPRSPDHAPAGSGGMATGAGIGSGRVNAGAASVRQAMNAAVAARQAELV